MTDKQKEIFQKMVSGEIDLNPWGRGFWESDKDGYVHFIHSQHPYWNDYQKAWEAYENAPLVKAMK